MLEKETKDYASRPQISGTIVPSRLMKTKSLAIDNKRKPERSFRFEATRIVTGGESIPGERSRFCGRSRPVPGRDLMAGICSNDSARAKFRDAPGLFCAGHEC